MAYYYGLESVSSGAIPLTTELEPHEVEGDLSVVAATAEETLDEGVERGIVSPELLTFARETLGEAGREAALVLPLHNLLSRHVVLHSAQSPETRAERLYGVSMQGTTRRGRVEEWIWSESSREHPNGSYQGKTAHKNPGALTMWSSWLVATSLEELEQMTEWKRSQSKQLHNLERQAPLGKAGKASALVESAYGGIDVTDPNRAIREFSARMLTAAMMHRVHDVFGRNLIDHDHALIEPRLLQLFASIQGKHHHTYREYVNKVDAAAQLVAVEGSIESARSQVLATMVGADTACFLGKVWADLGQFVARA